MDGAVEWGVCNPLMNNSQGHSRDSGTAGQSMGGGWLNRWCDKMGSTEDTKIVLFWAIDRK